MWLLLGLELVARALPPGTVPAEVRHFGDTPIGVPAAPFSLDGANWTASNARLGISVGATVPGDIISDLQRAGLHRPAFAANSPLFEREWLNASARALWQHPNRNWTYAKRFTAPADAAFLVLDGVKMGAEVRLNGVRLGNAVSQWLRYVYLVRALLKSGANANELVLAFTNALDGKVQGRYMSIAGYNVPGSDWTPLPNPVGSSVGINILEVCNLCFSWTYGIWKSVSLVPLPDAAPTAAIEHLQLQTFLAPLPAALAHVSKTTPEVVLDYYKQTGLFHFTLRH
jgi:hypothetical protein